jgi:hypothetical protein
VDAPGSLGAGRPAPTARLPVGGDLLRDRQPGDLMPKAQADSLID